MAFVLPEFSPPDFAHPPLRDAPLVTFKEVVQPGVAPENYHATTIFPEYFQIAKGQWRLPLESRMDCVVVLEPDDSLSVKEFRRLRVGELVACGRGENGEDGIFVHTGAFAFPRHVMEKFAFRTHTTRETAFSIDYDELYELLAYERDNGFILWVLGPAVVFDHDARNAFVDIIHEGYVHAILAGNALATHDVEGSLYGTALGQDLYSKQHAKAGHYKHLDALNRIRQVGSMETACRQGLIRDGVMRALIDRQIPCVLAGSIRDDGPMPEVLADVYRAQDDMRSLVRRATTVLALATQLHGIAAGNMTPSYKVAGGGAIRPVYFYSVDMSEFATNKLVNRGSLTARTILTNVQDFVVTLRRGLGG
ncbi:hypothetical protein [Desulfoferrobacter suflitae]|uniref:ornithine cyclodeaminase family domain n=1 Tax=Desulfoferrobacter suflitae TaxID=2865782 RepID=UPI0021643BB9|nr:hypothetical protein [Desulfoferrobacter suflitae]MCK8601316.1 hypothetical protein [Desulfoferrobacter suflitae]